MQDWEYSFTPKQSKKTSNNFHISEEVRKIISYNMTPFKENINNIPLTPVTHRLDSKLEEAIKQLDVKELMNETLEYICRNIDSNVICSLNLNTIQRSILFQLLALINDGLVFIVSYNYILLKEKLRRIQDIVSWAAINPDVQETQLQYILQNISSKEIKLLIVHPDMLQFVNIENLNIQLLLLDQSNYYLPFEIGRIHNDLIKQLNKCNAKSIHILLPTVQDVYLYNLKEQHPFHREFLSFREEVHLDISITCTRDEQPIKQLMILLKSQRLFRKNGILIYCNNVENVQLQLQQNGFKSGSIDNRKSEIQKQNIYYEFAASTIDIIILPSGYLLPEGLKNFVYLSVHLNLPQNIETLLLDIQELNKEANSHIFLSDDLYFKQRNQLCSRFSQIENINYLISESIYSQDVIQHDDNDISYWLTNKWLNKQGNQQNHKIKKLLIHQIIQQLDFNRANFNLILQQLEQSRWIDIQLIIPIEIIIFSSCNEDLMTNVHNYGKKCGTIAGGLKCNVEDIIRNLNINALQLIQLLKSSNSKYEIIEEAQLIKILHYPSHSELQAKVIDIYTYIQKINLVKINNLDTVYLLAKSGSFRSLEYMWKQIQLQNNSEKLINSIYNYLDQKNYIDQHTDLELPFSRLETQRDKSTLLSDLKIILQDITDKELSWIQKENIATKALIILQGLRINNKQYKSLPQWGKYRTFNYQKIHQVIHEMIDQAIDRSSQISIRKKLKI